MKTYTIHVIEVHVGRKWSMSLNGSSAFEDRAEAEQELRNHKAKDCTVMEYRVTPYIRKEDR